jgi:hypothetical protein
MLGPTDSVPVGRINQEHVIPLSELQLRELIGSGAEGKVGWVLLRERGVPQNRNVCPRTRDGSDKVCGRDSLSTDPRPLRTAMAF